jgi:hypothetical protein
MADRAGPEEVVESAAERLAAAAHLRPLATVVRRHPPELPPLAPARRGAIVRRSAAFAAVSAAKRCSA